MEGWGDHFLFYFFNSTPSTGNGWLVAQMDGVGGWMDGRGGGGGGGGVFLLW